MSVKIDRSGLDKLIKNAKELEGQSQLRMDEFMPPAFISAHSKFSDLGEMLSSSGFKLEKAEDFAAIPDDEWDAFISSNTDFGTWSEMQQSALTEHVKSRLSRGL